MSNFDAIYPVVIVQDRYHGTYSGGLWFAIAEADAPYPVLELEPTRATFCVEEGPNGTDEEAQAFWRARPYWIGSGNDPAEALADLAAWMSAQVG